LLLLLAGGSGTVLTFSLHSQVLWRRCYGSGQRFTAVYVSKRTAVGLLATPGGFMRDRRRTPSNCGQLGADVVELHCPLSM